MVADLHLLPEPAATYVALCSRGFIGLTFVFSLVGKRRSRAAYDEFLASVEHLARPLPGRLLAPLVVLGEAAVPLLLLSGRTAVAGFGCALGLLAAFTVVLVREHRRGSRVPCHCFGLSRAPVGRLQLTRNAVLLGVATAGLALCWPGGGPAVATSGPGVAVALVVAAGAALLVPLAELVHDLFGTSTAH